MRQLTSSVLLGLLYTFSALAQPLSVDVDTIALWNFDTDTALTVTDISGNSLHGTAHNADLVAFPVPVYGNARYFKDQTSYLSFGSLAYNSPLDLASLNEWSVEFLMRRDATLSGMRNIFDNGIITVQTNEGKLAAYYKQNGTKHGVEAFIPLALNTDYRASVVFKNNELALLINGGVWARVTIPSRKKIDKKSYGNPIRVGGTPSVGISKYEIGVTHGCLVTDEGQMKCWGDNTSGALGIGNTVTNSLPVNVEKFSAPTDFALSSGSSCAIKAGKVYCWGSNASGELGQPLLTNSTLPFEISGITNAIDVEMGFNHACAILADSSVKCWGGNSFGELGHGVFSATSLPTTVPSLSNVQKIALGSAHTCALISTGAVYCWGKNTNGQLGTAGSNSAIPLLVAVSGASDIAIGKEHSCAQLSANSIKCWGDNTYGQLGNNSTTSSATAVSVSNLGSANISALRSGLGNHSCIIDSGLIKCWGQNDKEQIGYAVGGLTYTAVPLTIPNINNVSSLELGFRNNCYQQSNKILSCLGDNSSSQLGSGSTVSFTSLPAPVLAVKQGHAQGFLDDIRVSSVARSSLVMPELSWVSPVGTVSTANPTISIAVASTLPIQPSTIEAKLNGIVVTGLTYNSGIISGILSQNFRVGENRLEVVIGDTTLNLGTLVKTIVYSQMLNPEKPILLTSKGFNTCYVTGEGYVWCWGSNEFGQLGNELMKYSSTPVKNPHLKNIVSLAHGGSAICATDRDGVVKCWGSNLTVQLGVGSWDFKKSSLPIQLNFPKPVVKISAGYSNFCALHADKTMSCWGSNGFNMLSNGGPYPVVPTLNTITDVKDVFLGVTNSCYIKMNNVLYCWGDNYVGQVGNGSYSPNINTPVEILSNVKNVVIGNQNICAQTYASENYCWGSNSSQQVSDILGEASYSAPELVTATSVNIQSMHLGEGLVCVLDDMQIASCWGQNIHGELGNGGIGTQTGIAYSINSINFSQIAAWNNTACGLSLDQDIYCWGSNSIGQAGSPNLGNISVPTLVAPHTMPITTGLSSLAAGEANTCMKKDTDYYCWGSNQRDQIGILSRNFLELYPQKVLGSSHVQSSVGYGFICHLTNTGSVSCAGLNNLGQTGQVSGAITRTPTVVPGLTNVAQVEAGIDFSCARKTDGTVACWGTNGNGQLGRVGAASPTPQIIADLAGVVEISVAKRGYHACARKNDGSVYCWGRNSNGQIGAKLQDYFTPVEQPYFYPSKGISLGGDTTCSINQDDKVLCIGSNIYGQLGTGTQYSNTSFATVEIKNPIQKIHTGRFHTCALDTTGTVYCWGRNNYGQLGNGLAEDSLVPVTTIKNIVELASGNDHVCGINSANKLACWGFGGVGQLGNGLAHEYNNLPVFSDVTKK